MTVIRAIFWDSDNTLIHTAPLHWGKHEGVLQSCGIHLDKARDARRIYENNGAQNWQWLAAERGLTINSQDYLDAIDKWYRDHVSKAPLRPGIVETLELAKDKEIPQAVVSNGRRRSLMASLEAKDLPAYFEFILAKEDYEGRKPDPSPYLTALERMQDHCAEPLRADQCLVVEDDPLGVEAGHRAGMQTLHRPITVDQDCSRFADICVPAERDFTSLMAQILNR